MDEFIYQQIEQRFPDVLVKLEGRRQLKGKVTLEVILFDFDGKILAKHTQ